MADVNQVIRNLLDVRETLELYRDAIGAQWIDDAIAALREKEPVKAVHLHNQYHTITEQITFTDKCGNCGGYLINTWKACPLCGKAVKWDG